MEIRRDWENPPKAHKECRDREAAKWFERDCKHCGKAMKLNRDWNNLPEYHKECEVYFVQCEICNRDLKVHRGWSTPPRSHKECLAQFKPKDVYCIDCNKLFTIKTGTQLKCRQQGWDLPRRCQECKDDRLLITGAIEALRDTYPFALRAEITQRGFFFPEKVVVVKGKKSGEVVAEVKMDVKGFLIDVHRVAEVFDPATGNRISYTREGREGLLESGFNPRRTADTYANDGTKTHRTKMEREGIINPHFVPKTRKQ